MGKIKKRNKEEKTIRKKKYKIKYGKWFWKDIEKVHENLAENGKNSHEKFEKETKKILEHLQEYPYMFQIMDNDKNARRFFISKYVVIYKVKDNFIMLERILPSNSNYIQKEIYKIKFPKILK